MKDADNCAIDEFMINSLILMEHAAIKSVEIITNKFQSPCKCIVLCGKGNNGGDGFAIARLLKLKGYWVTAAYFCDSDSFSPDCKTNFEIAKKLGINMLCDASMFKEAVSASAFTVDALYGFGFSGALNAFDAELVKTINHFSNYIYSIDIPSGICADNGGVFEDAVTANETLTFTAYKKSAFLFPSANYYGKITVLDISVPGSAISDYIAKTIEMPKIQKREKNINKSDMGKILVIAGSISMSGAAYMSAISALKSGAGLVSLAVPECISQFVRISPEIMTIPLPCENGSFSSEAADELAALVNNYDSVVFGPGISRNEDISYILTKILGVCKTTLIIDADGLFALKDKCEILNNALCEIIITPHSMEMARLVNMEVSQIEEKRFEICKDFSEKYAVCTVLKGPYTIVCDKSGEIAVNNLTANSGMATAGSGDVLSGIIAAMSAKADNIFEATKAAVYIHGLAGDFACEKFGEASMCATDIIDNISSALLHN